MSLRDYLSISDEQMRRLEGLYAGYRKMYEDPANCSPKIVVDLPREHIASVPDLMDDPLLMLRDELDEVRVHLGLGDDSAPTVRVQLGTAQVAAAFGCEMHVFEHSPPASSGPVMKSAGDIYRMRKPPIESGLYGEMRAFTEIWLDNLPRGVHIQHPDIQSPFNNAHFIRGDAIFTDCREDPVAVDVLLDIVTDYMIDLTHWLKGMISRDKDWFFDRGALWKGQARISNYHVHMMSPRFYAEHVLLRDMRFMRAIGGGVVCYRGADDEIIRRFFINQDLTGLDFESHYHDLWQLAEMAPAKVTLLTELRRDSDAYEGLARGEWPPKRNIILHLSAADAAQGREMLAALRRSVPGGVD